MPKATFSLAGGLSEFGESGERARDEWSCTGKSQRETEPGKPGSLWKIHYCVRALYLKCNFFKVTADIGQGTGESLKQTTSVGSVLIPAGRRIGGRE